MLSFSGTYALWITAKKLGVSEKYGSCSGYRDSKSDTIIAFYFSDPFPLFLVQDHFSCKYVGGASNKGRV